MPLRLPYYIVGVLSVATLAFAALGVRTSYFKPTFGNPMGGTQVLTPSSHLLINRNGWVTLQNWKPPHGPPSNVVFTFPWWPVALVAAVVLGWVVLRLAKSRSGPPDRGFEPKHVGASADGA